MSVRHLGREATGFPNKEIKRRKLYFIFLSSDSAQEQTDVTIKGLSQLGNTKLNHINLFGLRGGYEGK